MKWLRALFLSALFLNSTASTSAQEYDFEHSYGDVLSPTADAFEVEHRNLQKVASGFASYWRPVQNGVEARLTHKFTFRRPATKAYFNYVLGNFVFSETTFAKGALWVAKDGKNWVQLGGVPTVTSSMGIAGSLPESVLGADTLWFQARVTTYGDTSSAKLLFARSDDPTPGAKCFRLRVEFAKPEVIIDRLASDSGCLLTLLGKTKPSIQSNLRLIFGIGRTSSTSRASSLR